MKNWTIIMVTMVTTYLPWKLEGRIIVTSAGNYLINGFL
jgi:hypothetical protein